MAKSELVNVVTPPGDLYYVNISGQGKENYNEDGFEYVASIRLEGDKAEKLKSEIDEVAKQMPKDHYLKSTGYKELVVDKDGNLRSPTKRKPKTDDEKGTGIYEFQFRTSTTFADGKAKKITVRNRKNQKVDLGETRVGNGSYGAISGKMKGGSYKDEFSVSLYLNAIQLIKLEEYVADDGFDAYEDVEDGFDGVEDAETGFISQPEEEVKEEPKEKVKPKL